MKGSRELVAARATERAWWFAHEYLVKVPVRALMFDVDGVVIRHPAGRSWTSDLLADLGIDPAELDREFFSAHFDHVLAGRSDLLSCLHRVLPKISSVSPQTLTEYWFSHDASLDRRLIADLPQAREQDLAVELATIQEHHRARYLWRSLSLCEHFDAMHYAADLGAFKTQLRFYCLVGSRTGLTPAEHCLIDDSSDNLVVAKRAGWQTFLWTSRSCIGDVLLSVNR